MRALIIFFLLCTSNGTYAQLTIGINTGVANNKLHTNISNYKYSSYHAENGLITSISVRYEINSWLALRADPGFIEKNFSLHQNLPAQPATKLKSSFNYLHFPLLAQLSIGTNKLRAYTTMGGYAAFWMSGHVKGTMLDGFNYTFPDFIHTVQEADGNYEFDSRRDRRLQAGWLLGAGVEYSAGKTITGFTEVTHYEDLTDQQKNYMLAQVPRYNITTAITAGVLYHVNFKKP